MLKYYDDTKEIGEVGPKRRVEFNYWQSLLAAAAPAAEAKIRSAINSYVDDKKAKHGWTKECWFCSSFVPGQNWAGTPYQPIYDAMLERYLCDRLPAHDPLYIRPRPGPFSVVLQ